MRIIPLIFMFSFLTSCALVQKKEPLPASASIKNELSKIEIDISTGAYKKAIKRLEKIIEVSTQTDAGDDAYIMLGLVQFRLGDYNSSYKSYISVINSEYSSPREVDAILGAGNALYKLGRYDEALSLTLRALKYSSLTMATKIEIYTLRYNIQIQLGDRLDALRSLVFLAQNIADKVKQERYRIKSIEFVDSRLHEDELKTVANDSSFGYLRGPSLYRVGNAAFEQRDYSRAEDYFLDVISLLPNSDLAINAQTYIEQIEARRRVSPFTIGVVLPLSGKHASIAQKTLRGLQMGLGINDRVPSEFKLAVIDSEANTDTARRAVERLVVEDGAIAIVGDILSKTAEAVAKKADELGVPIIGLSQKSGLTLIGENVFRNALTSETIVKALVQDAMENYGLRRFAILYPNDAYGVEYTNLFWDEVLTRGGQITAAQTYSTSEKDFSWPVSRLIGTYYVEDRADEYTTIVRNWFSQQKVITSRVTPPSDLLGPIIDFEAIFIPDAIKPLGQIASMLVYNDVKNIRLLGTNLWNSSSLIERGTALVEGSLFVDEKSSTENLLQRTQFFRDYKSIFGEEPSLFEAQSYDIGLILRALIQRDGARSRTALREGLLKTHNFRGTVGEINMTESREFSRPLSILTVHGGKIELARPPIKSSTN